MIIVISPLKALMNDQYEKNSQLGIATSVIHSGINDSQKKKEYTNITSGKLKLIYISPETFLLDSFQEKIQNLKVKLIVVDEAHCVYAWGKNFFVLNMLKLQINLKN